MSLKKMYNLLFFLLLLSGNLMAQPPCTEYPSPTIVPDFVAHCQDPKPHDQSRNNPQTEPKEECFVACDSTWMTYSTFNNPNNTYVWEVFGAANWSNSGTNSQQVYWTGPGAGMVQVTETTQDGCSTTVSICVDIVESPTADFTSIPEAVNDEIIICNGGEVFFQDASSDDVITWAWDFGDGAFSNDPSPSHIFGSVGTWVVTLTVYNDCGCSNTKEVKVIVLPETAPVISCISTLCAGTQGTYSVNACDGATFLWTIIGGSSPDYTANPVIVDWDSGNTTGQGILTVEIFGCDDACPVPSTTVVPILTPLLSMTGPTLVCVGDITEYSIPPQPSMTYSWTLSGPSNNQFIFSAADQDHSAEIEWNIAGGPYQLCVFPQHTISEFKDSCERYNRICIDINVRNPFEIFGPDEICEGDGGTFSTIPGSISATWDAIPQGGGTPISLGTGSNSANVNILPAGIYQIVASSPNPLTCNPEAYAFIVVKPTAPIVSISGNQTVCPGSTHNYIATADPGYFVTWDAGSTGTVLGSGNEVAITWDNSGGPYVITVTHENMLPPSCPSTNTLTVNELVPNIPVIQTVPTPNVTEVCTDGTMAFSVPVDNDITYYEWEILPATIGSVITGQNTENINVQFNNIPNLGTTIQLTYVVCGVTQPVVTYDIDVLASPNITLTVPSEACQLASPGTQLTADLPLGTSGSISWQWFVDGLNIGSGSGTVSNSITYSFPNYGTQLVTAEVTITGGSCPGVFTATQLINVKPAPVVNITGLASATHCDGGIFDQVHLFASVQNAAGDPSGNYSYTWSPGGATTTDIIVTTPGTYTLSVLDNDTGCEISSNFYVSPCGDPLPPCNANLTATRSCSNIFSFSASLSSPYIYNPTWSFGDGSPSVSGTSPPPHPYEHSGYYAATFTAEDAFGNVCKSTISVVVFFVPNFIAEFSCPSNQILVDLINQTDHLGFVEPNLTYVWTDFNGTFISNAENPTGLNLTGFVQPINLEVTYNNSPNVVCDVSETINVPTPVVASFTAADNVCEGTPVQFTNTSVGGTIISATWDFDDLSGSNLIPSAQRTYVYSASGYYPSLTVEDEYGCTSSVTAINPLVIHENTLAGNVTVTGPTSPSCPTVNLTANPSGQNYDWFQVNNGGSDVPYGTSQTSSNIGTTGEYYVIVSDNLGCSAQSDNEEVIVIPPPTAFILGETTYCHNEFVTLSANQGGDYSYLWSVTPAISISTTSPQVSFYANAPTTQTTYTFTVVVTNNATGCSNTATLQVDIHPQPSISIQPVSPACAPTSLTSNPSADITSISWSTGSTLVTTDVLGGGTVEVTGFTDAGCSASDTYIVGDGPDISDVAVGCYCFPVPTLWTAPAGYNYTYEWFEQGVGSLGVYSQTYLIDHSGIYNVIVTDSNGCTSESDDIIVDIGGECERCEFRVYGFEWECIGIDENTGGTIYSYTAQVTNFYSSLSGFSGNSNEGIVGPITPNSLPGNFAVTPISGTFILLPGYSSAVITFSGAGANVNCDYKVEILNFPDCGTPPPCDVDWKEPKVECIYSYQGWNYYSFTVEAINNGAQITDLVMYPCSDPYVTITSNTSTLNPGSNIIEGYLRVRDGLSQDCIRICGFDTFHKKICCWKIDLKFPDCKVQQPCKDIKIESKAMWCIAPNVDYQGNRVYYFNIQVSGPFVNGDASLIPYISQAENHVSDLSVSSFGNYYTLTGTIFDVPPSDDPLCFGIRLISPEGKVCFTKICLKVPYCLSEGGPEDRLVQDNDDDMILKDVVELQVSPNPASTMIMVDYNTKFAGNTSLKLTGLNGQVVRHYSNLFTNRLIPVDISTLEDGMYFLTIYEDGVLKAQEKVVVLGD